MCVSFIDPSPICVMYHVQSVTVNMFEQVTSHNHLTTSAMYTQTLLSSSYHSDPIYFYQVWRSSYISQPSAQSVQFHPHPPNPISHVKCFRPRVIGIWEGLWWQPIRGDKLHSIHRIPGSIFTPTAGS